MDREDLERLLEEVRKRAIAQPGLDLVVLHGSRARGDATPTSDWDFAFLGDETVDVEQLAVDLTDASLGGEVDVVDLRRAGGLLRYRVARDGVVLFDRSGHAFETFAIAALRFWFDAAPTLNRAYDQLLAEAAK